MDQIIEMVVQEIDELLKRHALLAKRVLKKFNRLNAERKALRRASSEMLGVFIKEIDVLTPEKLKVVRKVRSVLGR